MMRAIAIVVAVMFWAPLASAQSMYLNHKKTAFATIDVLTNDAINTAVWTGWLPVHEFGAVVFEISHTYSAGTDVSMTCQTSDDPSTTAGSGYDVQKLQDSATAGTSDGYAHIWREPSGATNKWTWTVGNLPHDLINCSFVATGGDANNKATVRWRAVSP